jgi:hypothetical protein
VIGYPPADEAIKNYFFALQPADPEAYAKHYTAFFISLFNDLATLITEKQWSKPSELRDWLAIGGDYKTYGTNRLQFYSKVTERASNVSVHSHPCYFFSHGPRFSPTWNSRPLLSRQHHKQISNRLSSNLPLTSFAFAGLRLLTPSIRPYIV